MIQKDFFLPLKISLSAVHLFTYNKRSLKENVFRLIAQYKFSFFKENLAFCFYLNLYVEIKREFRLVCSCTSCAHFSSCVVHVFFVTNVTLHAIAITYMRKTKESTAHIRGKSFSLVEFSRLDGKIKLLKKTPMSKDLVLFEVVLGLEKM